MKTTKCETGQILQKERAALATERNYPQWNRTEGKQLKEKNRTPHSNAHTRACHTLSICVHMYTHTHTQRPHSPEETCTARESTELLTQGSPSSEQQTSQTAAPVGTEVCWKTAKQNLFYWEREHTHRLQACTPWSEKTKVADADRKRVKGDLQAERQWQLQI